MDAFVLLVTTNWVAGLLLLAGIALLSAEMFFPGFGVLGIAGLISLVVGIFVAYQSPLQTFLLILILVVILGLIFFIAVRSATRGRLSRTPLVLDDATSAEAGYSSTQDMSALVGQTGKTMSILRPAGAAMVGNQRLDVVTDGAFVKEGEWVRVEMVEGRRIVVRQITEEEALAIAQAQGEAPPPQA